MKVYFAGPLFTPYERGFIDECAAQLRAAGFDVFVPHEHELAGTDTTPATIFRKDWDGLEPANAVVALLDGPTVDDGTACEIGMFAELARSGGPQYRGIVAITTDIRLERRRAGNVVGGGMNLFVGGAIESCGRIVHSVDEVVAALREL